MRLRLETADRPPFWLAGNPALNERTEQSQVLTEQLQIGRTQQELAGADWDAKTFFDRGNQSVSLLASVKWQFTGQWEAMDFVASLAPNDKAASLHAWTGDVWIREDKEGTDEYKEWLLPKAVITLTGAQRNGVRVELSYRISASGFGASGTGSQQTFNLVANSAGFNGIRITPAMILASLTGAPAGLTGAYGTVYVTPRGADTVFIAFLYFGLFSGGMSAADQAAVVTGSFASQSAAAIAAINAYFAASAVSGGVESGDFVIRQPSDALCDDIQITIFAPYPDGEETITYYLAWVNLVIEADGVVNLTASHLGTDYQLQAFSE